MERWSDTVLRIAWTWTGSVHDARDICQTVLLKLLTSPRRFDEERLERAWVVRVTVNCCKDWKKSAWVRRRLPLEAAAHAAVHLPEVGESPVLAAVYLRYYEGYEPAEIGALMGCTASQVSTYLYRGKAKLRKTLGGAYGQECLSE
ncbi:sigma-70 family RNA polymerase sigma factor [Oscillibacter valericigenes]|uniref:RNA polymerase sigma factor n=1 Tax=Oscillibacter valericigenes TaxID=351091 RepID=UPI0030B8B4A7